MTAVRNLRKIRKRFGLSQADVADLLGVTTAAVSYWESMQKTPRRDKASKLSNVFGVGVEELLRPAI